MSILFPYSVLLLFLCLWPLFAAAALFLSSSPFFLSLLSSFTSFFLSFLSSFFSFPPACLVALVPLSSSFSFCFCTYYSMTAIRCCFTPLLLYSLFFSLLFSSLLSPTGAGPRKRIVLG